MYVCCVLDAYDRVLQIPCAAICFIEYIHARRDAFALAAASIVLLVTSILIAAQVGCGLSTRELNVNCAGIGFVRADGDCTVSAACYCADSVHTHRRTHRNTRRVCVVAMRIWRLLSQASVKRNGETRSM